MGRMHTNALKLEALFGKEGTGFMRMHVACSRSVLQETLVSLRHAYEND